MKPVGWLGLGWSRRCSSWAYSSRRRPWPRPRRAFIGKPCRTPMRCRSSSSPLSGNTNPFDFAHNRDTRGELRRNIGPGGLCAHLFPVRSRRHGLRSSCPWGRISGEVTVGGITVNQSASGFGDPMLEFDINLLGPRAQKNIPDVLRYEPGFSVDFIADLALPIGEYENSQPLNIGQNRWYGRLGVPVIWQLGPWVPGRRTTLGIPARRVALREQRRLRRADDEDRTAVPAGRAPVARLQPSASGGRSTPAWYKGGQASINGVQGKELNNLGLGLTLGYAINENLNLTFGYKSTVNDSAPDDLRMDNFMVSFVYGWHPLLEGSRRLKGE